MYAWKNFPTSTILTLCGAPFPSIEGKLFFFCNSVGKTGKIRKCGVLKGELKEHGNKNGKIWSNTEKGRE